MKTQIFAQDIQMIFNIEEWVENERIRANKLNYDRT